MVSKEGAALRTAILLCTYNGEPYINELLESLVSQTSSDFFICVRDDGSTDRTKEIVQSFISKYPELIINLTEGKHRGYPASFWSLLRDSPIADAYAFCDQDDVWDPQKIECAERMLKEEDPSVPLLYIHDYENCSSELLPIDVHSLADQSTLTADKIAFYTIASGFSMVINETMREKLLSEHLDYDPLFHDEWCIWTAFFYGKILHDSRVLVKYRRHDGTVTTYGSGKKKDTFAWVHDEILGPEFVKKCERIRIFLHKNPDLPENIRKKWALFSGEKKSLPNYFLRLFYPHRLRPSIGGEAALRMLFLIHY